MCDSQQTSQRDDNETFKFHDMGIDDRILKAICKLGWAEPTLIQEKAIPLALEGRDILARARTGSGKTGAFVIPVIQKILNLKQTAQQQEIKALMMAPSKELCKQIFKNVMVSINLCVFTSSSDNWVIPCQVDQWRECYPLRKNRKKYML